MRGSVVSVPSRPDGSIALIIPGEAIDRSAAIAIRLDSSISVSTTPSRNSRLSVFAGTRQFRPGSLSLIDIRRIQRDEEFRY